MRKIYFIAFVLASLLMFALPSASSAQVSVGLSIRIGPPALPVYAQPICPGAGYVWAPGYWAYGPDGYYWVPGTWVIAPVGLLWTPGYWGWGDGFYAWHTGYWGPHVGFYGGLNYGYGYGGVGFVGGRWSGRVFVYNSAVTHVDTTVIHNTYVDRTVIVNNNTHVSYNGGTGGSTATPTPEERMAENEHHTPPVAAQVQHEHMASTNRSFLASENHGHPAVAATARPGRFSGPGVTTSHGANTSFRPPAQNENHTAEVHTDKVPPHNQPHPEAKPKNEKPKEQGDQHDNR